jgi:hypothetical protein
VVNFRVPTTDQFSSAVDKVELWTAENLTKLRDDLSSAATEMHRLRPTIELAKLRPSDCELEAADAQEINASAR